jgi:hypothetical protein
MQYDRYTNVLHETPAVTSEALVPFYWNTERHISEDTNLQNVSYTSQILVHKLVDMLEIHFK